MAEILIEGIIGRHVNSKRIRDDLAGIAPNRAVVRFSSRGGDLMEGISIFNVLAEHASKYGLDGIIDGPCFSAAAMAAMACNTLRMKENTLLMFHNVKVKGEMLDLDNIDKVKETLQAHQDQLVNTLTARMQMGREEVMSFLSEEKFLRPEDALIRGLVDGVLPVSRERMEIRNFFADEESAPKDILEFVNSFNERSQSMALREVVSTLNLQIENLSDKTEDTVIEKAIVNHFNDLTGRITTLEKQITDAKEPEKDEEINVSGTMVNVVQEYREMKIDNFVSKGKCTPAQAKQLKEKHCSESAAKESYINETSKEVFDAAMEVLDGNETITLGGKSKAQTVPKTSNESSLLVDLLDEANSN